MRIVTNPKIFDPPSPMEAAVMFCQRLVDWPRAVMVIPSRRHWSGKSIKKLPTLTGRKVAQANAGKEQHRRQQ